MGTDVETVELTQTLTRLWAEVLESPDITPDSDFFSLGGDSMLAVELSFLIASEIGERVPVKQLVDAPTPARLAAAIRERAVRQADTSG
jgi:acyl carrier protein